MLTWLSALLAAAGGLALLLRALRGSFAVVLRAGEEVSASGLAEASARRGDLTELAERQRVTRIARSAKRRQILLTLLWALWLVLPLAFGGARLAWAPAALLWLAPRDVEPLRTRR